MSYTQLTLLQRYQIHAWFKAGLNQTEIAKEIGCHKSTISRELRRNRGKRDYYALLAHLLAAKRRRNSHKPRISKRTWRLIERYLRLDWSPQQIHGWLKRQRKLTVSPERIYQHIYADQRRGGTLYRHLRSQKKQRRRYRGYIRRGQIPNRVSIDERPKIVASKRRFGDWEADTIIGANHQGALLSFTERKSKLVRLIKLKDKCASTVCRTAIKLLASVRDRLHTITVDNGKEFCEHEALAAELSCKIYFAHPYASWERGVNENSNGLIRQYFPKKYDFAQITNRDVQRAEARLNNRPRKTLGYRTPNEVFFK
jgi:IS30 family transposase